MNNKAAEVCLKVMNGTLLIDGAKSLRGVRLFLGSVLGGKLEDGVWRIEPKGRTLDELCIIVNHWLNKHGVNPELIGIVDVSVERDQERQKSFSRARDAGIQFRQGSPVFAEDNLHKLLEMAGWNRASRELYPHQINASLHALVAANTANFSVPGAGKTATTLAVAAAQFSSGNIDLLLVIGPLASFQPWESETAICLPTWKTLRLRGSATERRRMLRNLKPLDSNPTVVLTSYAGAVNDLASLKDLCRKMKVMLVADESHRIKRFRGGQWADAVIEIAKLAVVRIILSGTPMPQSGRDLYTQLNVIWPGRELTGSREQFKPRVESHFPEVIDEVLPFVSRVSKEELGLPRPSVIYTKVQLNSDEAEIYDLLENHFRRSIRAANPNEADRLAALRRGRPMRLLQAATNPALLQEGGNMRVYEGTTPTLLQRINSLDLKLSPPAKYREAGEILTQLSNNEKCVVWSNFIQNLDLFAEYVRREHKIPVFQVDGRIATQSGINGLSESNEDKNEESRESIIKGFLDFEGKAILVTNPASCSESISLHRDCHNAIYLDRTYDCAQWLQSIDRIHRLGLPPNTKVQIFVLQAFSDDRPTIDQLVQMSLQTKESRMLTLLEGAVLSPLQDFPNADEGTLEDMRELLTYLLGREK